MTTTETTIAPSPDMTKHYGHAFLQRLAEKGHIKKFSGGRTVIQELEVYNIWQSGVGSSPESSFSAAEYQIHQIRTNNDSPNTYISDNLWQYCQDTLAACISLAPTVGIIGGIDRREYKWWRNLALTFSPDVGIPCAVWEMHKKLTRTMGEKRECPDVIICAPEDIEGVTVAVDACEMGCLVIPSTSSVHVVNYRMHRFPILFLNTDYIYLRPHKDCRDDMWAGALTFSHMAAHGALTRS
mgnify:CR=1 FL=1